VDGQPGTRQLSLKVNSPFFEELGGIPGQEWELLQADDPQLMQELTLEPSPPHCYSKRELARLRRGAFDGRCFYAFSGNHEKAFLLRMDKQRYFRVREAVPNPFASAGRAVFSIAPGTRITIYTPRHQAGTDLVVLLDVSESMKLMDFEREGGRVESRSEVAQGVVKLLLEWHTRESASGSRFALVIFGRDARAVFPDGMDGLVEISPHQGEMLCGKIPELTKRVDAAGSDLIGAINAAAKLSHNTESRDNETTFILISDGAFYSGQVRQNERRTSQNTAEPDVFAEFLRSFYEERGVSIHTITIGCEEWTRRLEPNLYNRDMTRPEGKRGHIPNPALLARIAQLTNAKTVSAENINDLRELFEARPEGTIITLLN
jgi:Mg-chelatase subunit ChlD